MKLSRKMSLSKSQRDLINDTTGYLLRAVALVLHDNYGFGEQRIGGGISGVQDVIDEYSDCYGADCLRTALDSKCRDKGLNFED